ncbi:strigolactone esterase D14-like [Lolium rigidum]|uniref:strigolactone esterase D14-like n=1 Tax=Lolium rigidum TaxID=89674 RepID=UPI001F5C59F1|nr:strigolactone esterase D14-like [Lolium rigidum]
MRKLRRRRRRHSGVSSRRHPPDPEQAAILASLNAERFGTLKEEQREFINDANLEHALEISRQRAATEEVGRLLMEAERQKLASLNAHRHYDSHGLGTDQSVWSRVLPYLTRDHRVVLYDLACAGSVNPDHFDFARYNGLDAYVDDLLSILDALSIKRCALVGHSVSGMIGIVASIRCPKLFAKLVLIGCSPCFQNDGDYHGGFEVEEVQEVFDAMSANYMAWATLNRKPEKLRGLASSAAPWWATPSPA